MLKALDVIQALPVRKRRTVRALARNSNIPEFTLQDRIKAGDFERHTNSLKPLLTRENEIHSCVIVYPLSTLSVAIRTSILAIDSLRQEETANNVDELIDNEDDH